MASQLNISYSSVGVANTGGGIINIGRDLVVGSSSEESFVELNPPRESKVFKGREEDIVKLEALFFKEGKRKVVIHGLPGFGKTELAVRFAKHCKDSTNIDKAFWINAETSENLKNHHKSLKRVYEIFENKRCLFIFDNGVSRSTVRQYEPPDVKNFYLLITSHIADWDDDIYQVSLKPLNMQTSLDVFRAILDYRYQKGEENIYKEMITFVSNVPLGIIVIAGHLRFKMDACKQKKFDTNHFLGEISRILNTEVHHCQSSYEKSICAVIFIVLEKINKQYFAESKKTRELSISVLGICGYLDPDMITIEEIKEIMECSEENTVDECVYLLENFSFIEYHDGFIKIHRLCQRILKRYFDEIKKDYYSVCLRWILRKENWSLHEETILMEADNKKETILDIYQQNVSENHYLQLKKLLTLLVQYDCYESCELIFNKISFEERKQFVNNMKLIYVACESYDADVRVLKLLLEYGDLNVQDSEDEKLLFTAFRNIDKMRMLLEQGADVQVQNSKGETLLHELNTAFSLKNEDKVRMARMLLDKGANVHVRDSKGKTPLHWASAAEEENIDIVRMLLEAGADVRVQDTEGKTPLHWASTKKNVDIVRMLLDNGADVHARNSEGRTPLHDASEDENVDIVRTLLDKGANMNIQDSEGKTPLHWASRLMNVDMVRILLEKGADVLVQENEGITPLHLASFHGNTDTIRMLLEKGADVHVTDINGNTPLHWASMFKNVDRMQILVMLLEKRVDEQVRNNELQWASQRWRRNVGIVQMLVQKGADVLARNNNGLTALHWASVEGNVDKVRMLLELGADVNLRDNEGRTPLHWACVEGNMDTVRLLLEKGVDAHVGDNDGNTPLLYACWQWNINVVGIMLEKFMLVLDNESKAPLNWASSRGRVNIVRFMLEKGADVHFQDKTGKTPLHWASKEGNEDIVRMLLDKGADVHVLDNEDSTPLHLASQYGNATIVLNLLEKGADILARDEDGKTPLHLASCRGHILIVIILMVRGADAHARDKTNLTSLDWAVVCKHTDIVNILRECIKKLT